jgi:succinate dehydrogenase / fumarate reductase membrane anchor subunit
MVKRTVVGAHYGLNDWLVQRVGAAVMALYVLFIGVLLLSLPQVGFNEWRSLFTLAWLRYVALLFFIGAFLHAWVGVRDILMDYVKPDGLRLFLEVLTVFALAIYGVWTVDILWGQ